jgi:hypothetical protein
VSRYVRFRSWLWVLLGGVGLSGCSTQTVYPASWPTLISQTTDHCEPLRGSFENVGSWAVSQDMDERLLASADLACEKGHWMFRHATWEVEGSVAAAPLDPDRTS